MVEKITKTPTPNEVVEKINDIIQNLITGATQTEAGVVKLYTGTGEAEDGAMTQKAITSAISTVLNSKLASTRANFDTSFQYLGGGTTSMSGTAQTSGFLCAGGSKKGSSMEIKVNGTTLGYVVGRDYGSGTISACVPVPHGASWSITGQCNWAYFIRCKVLG